MSTTNSTPILATGSLQSVDRFDGAPVGERRQRSDEIKAQAVAAALEPSGNFSALVRRPGVSQAPLFGLRTPFRKREVAALCGEA
jgi:transposase